MPTKIISSLAFVAFVVLGPNSAWAVATVIWGAPATIAGNADVATAGAAVFAYDWNSSAQTVNGVSFTAPGAGVTLSSDLNGGYGAFLTGTAVPAIGLSSAYQNVLTGGNYAGGGTACTVTLNNLAIGHQYQVQIWVDDSRSYGIGRLETVTSGGGNTVTLNYNTTATVGGVGQYTIGTFTADSTTQAITLTGNTSTQINAIQLRDQTIVGVTATPVFNPAAGGYFGAQTVTITSESGSTVFYTTDGSSPTNTSANGGAGAGSATISVPVSTTETINACATNSGKANSAIASATYTTVTAPVVGTPGDLILWYNQPGVVNLTQGLLIGNGRVGAIVPGQVAAENIVLNESSLWTGTANLSGDYDTSSTGGFGSYQLFGNLLISLPTHATYTVYRRMLDINTGVATVDYINNGVTYHREMFCTAPDQVLVVRLTASAAAAYTGSIQLVDGHSTVTASTANGLMFSGALANGEKYEAQLLAGNSGGSLVSSGGSLRFTNCDSLTLVVALGTDYVMDYSRSYHGNDPHTTVLQQAQAAAAKSFSTLETAHTNDFQSLFNRVSLDLGPGPSSRTNLPTDQRLAANLPNDDDPGMDALLFGYGRYLMISASRTGCPMNLQGIWNDNNSPAWGSDYHTDLNVEMMYNGVEVANLSECYQPLLNFLQSQIPAWRYVTTNAGTSINNAGYGYGFGGTNGWATRTSQNINGGQGWAWIEGANAWYCMYLWDHYAFTGDTNYLRNNAYPIMKEVCQFWQQHLKALPATNGVPAGTLVVTNGWSPEHGPVEDGVTCDQVLVWDVFNSFQQAAAILNTDAVYSATVAGLQANLLKPRIGPWGELREWFYTADTQGPDGNSSLMQFCGLYPGRQLTPEAAPWLAAGARVKLLSVGDVFNGEWDYVEHLTFYARLHDWWSARHTLALLYNVTEPNLNGKFSDSIAQLDSSCGVTAGIAEMLLQSHAGFINLLPALPNSWPVGSVSGLRARGGYTVGIIWTNAAASATITPSLTGTCEVHTPNPVTVTLGGVPVTVTNTASGCVQWPVVAGNTYALQWVLPPFPAQMPVPADYAAGVSIGTALTWLAGGTNYLHDVYFGTSSNAVANATTASPEYLGRTSETNFFLPWLLLPNTTCFWRVDEVDGSNIGTGTVWNFMTGATSYVWDANGAAAGIGGTGTWNTTSSRWDNGVNVWPGAGTANFALFEGAAGTVSIAAGGVSANGLYFGTAGYLIQNNTLTLNGSTPMVFVDPGINATIASAVAGSAGLTKTGTGRLVLSGANTYIGDTVIGGGTLAANGSLAAGSAVTVQAGATLGGTGVVNGPVTVNGMVAPGGSVGTLATGPETWNGGGDYACEINSTNATGCDLLNITGSLNVQATTGARFTVSLLSLTSSNTPGELASFNSAASYAWTIATASAGISNFTAGKFVVDTSAFSNAFAGVFSVTNIGNTLVVAYAGAPPPLVSLSSPTNGQYFVAPAAIPLNASVTVNGHIVSQVQYFSNGTNLVGSSTGGPLYNTNWTGVSAGSYSLTAVAAYESGNVGSATNGIFVLGPLNITSQAKLAGGSFQLTFTGPISQPYRVLGTNVVSAPLSTWAVLAGGTIGPDGSATFTDAAASTNALWFYYVQSP